MALTISQALAVSYPAVLAASRKPANQWSESAAMRLLERFGIIEHKSLGPTIECPLDWRRNAGAGFLATDLETTGLTKTDVISAASYTPAQLSVPMVWSKMDEVQNASENQKIAFVKALIENGLASHDDLIEDKLFETSTNGFLGLVTIVPDGGQGTVGGIDASVETFWRNPSGDYAADGSDLIATLTTSYNSACKGSGATMRPKFMLSGATPHALLESKLVPNQRYMDAAEASAGFKVLKFKDMDYAFSQHGDGTIYQLGKSLKLVVSKEYFRDRSETQEIQNANGFVSKIYSALQLVTDNKSRLAMDHSA